MAALQCHKLIKTEISINVLNNLSYAETCAAIKSAATDALPRLKIAILRNITVDAVAEYIKYQSLNIGFNAVVTIGDFDFILRNACEADKPPLSENPDIIWVFFKLEDFSNGLSQLFTNFSDKERLQEVERVKKYIDATIAAIREHTNATILWNAFEIPINPALGIADLQLPNGQKSLIRSLNNYIQETLISHRNSFLIDTNSCLSAIGSDSYFDERYWHIARAPYTHSALSAIADQGFKIIRALKGKAKKCLVLDCDNVLWGGIVGEDGLSGIELGRNYPGSQYIFFQQEVLNLYNRGIIIAICSKNNSDDVWQVFDKHPEIVLKREHIAAARINWQNKAQNIQEIANELNIGLDSLVFMDDSPIEIELIRKEFPEVVSIHLPPEKPSGFRTILAGLGLFDTPNYSEEDRTRGEMYKSQTKRNSILNKSIDLNSFYDSVEMEIIISRGDKHSLPRLAQLTQRTNQFNLSTKRYTELELEDLINSQNYEVLYLKLKDIFGEYGIVGLAIVKFEAESSIIDTFLMSCRALGRDVEKVLLSACVEASSRRNSKNIYGDYSPTTKNMAIKDLLPDNNFEPVSEQNGATTFSLRNLKKSNIAPTTHFKSILLPWN